MRLPDPDTLNPDDVVRDPTGKAVGLVMTDIRFAAPRFSIREFVEEVRAKIPDPGESLATLLTMFEENVKGPAMMGVTTTGMVTAGEAVSVHRPSKQHDDSFDRLVDEVYGPERLDDHTIHD